MWDEMLTPNGVPGHEQDTSEAGTQCSDDDRKWDKKATVSGHSTLPAFWDSFFISLNEYWRWAKLGVGVWLLLYDYIISPIHFPLSLGTFRTWSWDLGWEFGLWFDKSCNMHVFLNIYMCIHNSTFFPGSNWIVRDYWKYLPDLLVC